MVNKKLVTCKNCGKERLISVYQIRLPTHTGLCRDCAGLSRAGEKNYNWKGGRNKNSCGYIDVRVYPGDQFYTMSTQQDHYVREHRLVMARHLGRVLAPDEWVHHLNGIKDDNRIENLRLKTPSQHLKEHTRGYKDGYKQGYQDGLAQVKRMGDR